MQGFNPTLVRLRLLLWEAAVWDEAPAFQSHAGSIEAGPWRPVCGRRGIVSIPRWFD